MNSNALFSTRTLTLMSAGIAINMVLGQIASMLKLPIFLDSIGTIIVALLAGPIAALVAGLTGVGIDGAVAVSAVVVFRFATFWFPLLPGWFAFHALERRDAI